MPIQTPGRVNHIGTTLLPLASPITINFTGPATTWTELDLSAYIPENATGVIFYGFASNTISKLRKPGSTVDVPNADTQASTMMYCGVDSNRKLEFYKTAAPDQFLSLYGWFTTEAVFLDATLNFTTTTSSGWQDVNISSITGSDTAIGVIFGIKNSVTSAAVPTQRYGFRPKGSSEAEFTGVSQADYDYAVCGLDASEIFQVYNSAISSSTVQVKVIGYIKEGWTFNSTRPSQEVFGYPHNIVTNANDYGSLYVYLCTTAASPGTVRAQPLLSGSSATALLDSFESGTPPTGWTFNNGGNALNVLSRSSAWSTVGSNSIQIAVLASATSPTATRTGIDLTGYSQVEIDTQIVPVAGSTGTASLTMTIQDGTQTLISKITSTTNGGGTKLDTLRVQIPNDFNLATTTIVLTASSAGGNITANVRADNLRLSNPGLIIAGTTLTNFWRFGVIPVKGNNLRKWDMYSLNGSTFTSGITVEEIGRNLGPVRTEVAVGSVEFTMSSSNDYYKVDFIECNGASYPSEHIADSKELDADAYVDLFEIILANSAGKLYLKQNHDVTWQGNSYEGTGIKIEGVGSYADDEVARPKLSIFNPEGVFSYLVDQGLLENARVVRIRVLKEHIDADLPVYRRQQWFVKRVASVRRGLIGLELRDMIDGQNFMVPGRMFIPPEFPAVSLT